MSRKEDQVVTVTTANIGRLLLRVEMDAHRRGWDTPPSLHVIYDPTDAETVAAYARISQGLPASIGSIAARPCVPTDALAPNIAHAIFRLAMNFRYAGNHPATLRVRAMLGCPGFLGLLAVHEGWMRIAAPEERRALGSKRFADIPGSIETRHAIAATVDGQTAVVMRQRGQKPEIVEGKYSGSVVESLRTIVAAIAGQPLPEGEGTMPSGWTWEEQS